MKELKPFETWIIKHKDTGQIWQAPSSKTSWKKPAHAKNAWANMWGLHHCERLGVERIIEKGRSRLPRFDEQDQYVLEKLGTTHSERLTQAESILKDILNNYEAGDKIDNMIKEYFNQ